MKMYVGGGGGGGSERQRQRETQRLIDRNTHR